MIRLSRYTFDYAFRVLLVMLPFMTVLSIFTKERLGIPGFSFLKEVVLVSLLSTIAYYHVRGIKKVQWTNYDIIIILYIGVMIGISFFTTGITGILYGWKYDFSFLIAFFAIYHGYTFLEKSASYYMRLFLIAWGIMIFISMLLKWPFSEDLLLYLGYSGNPSNWQFGSSVPIFHGVDGANIRRFQGLLDGPNTMGAYLLLYIGILVYYFRWKKNWHFMLGCVIIVGVALILYTYSRSAALGLIWWVWIIILFSLRNIYKKYRTQFITLIFLLVLILGGIFIQYAGNMKAIIERWWSTNGHKERMKAWIERFLSHPFGQWLGSAGPAYRYMQNLENKDRKKIEESDRYYIPESWYIQQMVEGGILGFLLFLSILSYIGYRLFHIHIVLLGMFLSLCIMNLFLHTFESSVVSLSLFLLVWLFIAHSYHLHEWK